MHSLPFWLLDFHTDAFLCTYHLHIIICITNLQAPFCCTSTLATTLFEFDDKHPRHTYIHMHTFLISFQWNESLISIGNLSYDHIFGAICTAAIHKYYKYIYTYIYISNICYKNKFIGNFTFSTLKSIQFNSSFCSACSSSK